MDRKHLLLASALLALAGCGPKPATLAGKEWQVVVMGENTAPVGAGGRPLTMRFDEATGRVYGFSGCNQYNAAYTLKGDSLSFGPAFASRMSCSASDSLENVFLTQLLKTTNVTLDGEILILSGNGKAIRAHH